VRLWQGSWWKQQLLQVMPRTQLSVVVVVVVVVLLLSATLQVACKGRVGLGMKPKRLLWLQHPLLLALTQNAEGGLLD
jgi:hypothetical protein